MYYYLNLNAQSNGDHEIHKETCPYYYKNKNGFNFELVGVFDNEIEAVEYARKKYPYFRIDGCLYCCPNAHKS